jgi:hypothetical protein
VTGDACPHRHVGKNGGGKQDGPDAQNDMVEVGQGKRVGGFRCKNNVFLQKGQENRTFLCCGKGFAPHKSL